MLSLLKATVCYWIDNEVCYYVHIFTRISLYVFLLFYLYTFNYINVVYCVCLICITHLYFKIKLEEYVILLSGIFPFSYLIYNTLENKFDWLCFHQYYLLLGCSLIMICSKTKTIHLLLIDVFYILFNISINYCA